MRSKRGKNEAHLLRMVSEYQGGPRLRKRGKNLQEMLSKEGLDGKSVLLLRERNTANKATGTWEKHITEQAASVRALRQGCPVFPLLFVICFRELGRVLEQSGLRFDLRFLESGRRVVQSLSWFKAC